MSRQHTVRKAFGVFIPFLILLTLLLGLALLFDWWPMLRGGYGWQWQYKYPDLTHVARLLPGVLALAVYGAGVVALRRRPAPLFVAWCFLGTVAIPVALMAVKGPPLPLLLYRTISTDPTGAFTAASTITDLRATYAGWLAAMPGMLVPLPHMSVSSPIWPTLYYGLARILALSPDLSSALAWPLIRMQCQNYSFVTLDAARIASAWLGVLSPIWVALTVVPVYFLARRLADDRAARIAAAWLPLLPALALFGGALSTAYPPLTTAAVLLFWSAIRQPHRRRQFLSLVLTGAALAALVLWNLSTAPLALLCGLLILIMWRSDLDGPRPWSWLLLTGGPIALGALAAAALYWAVIGHSPLELLLTVMKVHTSLYKPYLPWLLLHPWDVALFAGVPTVAMAVYGGFRARSRPSRQFALALGLTIGLLVVLKLARGETGRVWLFLMPLIVIVAAAWLATLSARRVWLLAGAQVFWLLVTNLVLVTVWTVDVAPPPTYRQVALPPLTATLMPADAIFGDDEMKLTGYQAQYRPESHSLAVALHWQPLKRMATPYYFSGVLVAPDGTALPGENWQPLVEQFRTTCWSSRQPVVDQVIFTLPEDALPGKWWLSFSGFAYQEGQTPQPLLVRLPDGNTDHQIGLGPIEVKSATGQ
jgi:hypothetical protein